MSTRKRLIVIAGTFAQAKRHAERRGLLPASILWPRNVSDLAKAYNVPLYIAPSAWSHPDADRLMEYAGDRLELTYNYGRP